MPERAASKPAPAPGRSKRGAKAKTVLDRKSSPGWLTSDEDEISLRRWRGRTEGIEVVALEPQLGFFGAFRARSASGGQYEVEIRSLEERINSCGCIDHRVNGVGNLQAHRGRAGGGLRGQGARVPGRRRGRLCARRNIPGPPGRGRPERRMARQLAGRSRRARMARAMAARRRRPKSGPRQRRRAARGFPGSAAQSCTLRCASPDTSARGSRERAASVRVKRRAPHFEADVAAGRAEIDVLKFPLLPYQRLGALHLAFGERALLADDMGLGKTIQAIAACELLRAPQGRRARAGRLPGLAQGRMGGADRPLQRAVDRGSSFGPRGRSGSPPIARPPSSRSSTTSRCCRRRRHQRDPDA